MSLKTASVLATAVMLVAVGGLLVSHTLIAGNVAGQVLQGGAVLCALWVRVTFGRRSFHMAANPTVGGLVTTGPYRYVRHPIYVAVLLLVWAGVATHATRRSFTLAALATAAVVVRIRAEEELLVIRYPAYAAYAARTKRLIPGVL